MIRHNLCANLSADLILAVHRLKYNVKHLLTHPTFSGLIAVLAVGLWILIAAAPSFPFSGVTLKPTSHPLAFWQVIHYNIKVLDNQTARSIIVPTTLTQYELAAPLACLLVLSEGAVMDGSLAFVAVFAFRHRKQIVHAIGEAFVGTAHAFVFVCDLLADALGFVIEVLTWVPIHIVYPLWRRYHINVRDAVLQKQLSAKK